MRCPVCGTENPETELVCEVCRSSLRSTGHPAPTSPEDLGLTRPVMSKRRKEKILWHTLGGFLVVLALSGLVLVVGRGLAGALRAFPLAVVVGAPVGLVASLRRGDKFVPAGLGVAIMTALYFFVHDFFFGPGPLIPFGTLVEPILVAATFGALPGALMGLHVQLDQD